MTLINHSGRREVLVTLHDVLASEVQLRIEDRLDFRVSADPDADWVSVN